MRSWLPACLLISALACRGDERGAPRDLPQAEAEPEPEPEPPTALAPATPVDDPFAGIGALRPEPWTGWPLENVDIQIDAGWRVDPVSGKPELERAVSFAAEADAFVLAIAPGEVLEVGRDEHGDALELVIDHGDGIESRYAPLSDALVHAGLPVTRGAAIGLAHGKTLRLIVTVDGVAVDPLLVLRQPLHRWPALLRSLPTPPAPPAPPL